MLSLIPNPLQLPSGCYQASCVFDKHAAESVDFEKLGLKLPSRLKTAIAKRKSEFLAGRYCAQVALKKMRVDWRQAIEIGDNRVPCWPEGLVGSITHSKGFASAALASVEVMRGMGIDSEALIVEKTANNVRSHILTEMEDYEANAELVSSDRQYLTLIFSAKESIFKCLYPLVRQYFDFRHAVVELEATRPGHFRFRLLKDLGGEFGIGYSGAGLYSLTDDFVHTAVLLPREDT